MKKREQQATHRCECGAQASVTPTQSPWEFDVKCQCGRRGTISWAHASAPPTYVPRQTEQTTMTKQERERELLKASTPQDQKTSKFLPCELTPDEQRDRAQQLVAQLERADNLQAELKSVTKDYQRQINDASTKAGLLRSCVSSRREHREVVCTEFHHYRNAQVYVVRDDTGEITETRPMTPRERQRELPGTKAAVTTEAKDADAKRKQDEQPAAAGKKDKAARAKTREQQPST